MRNRLKYLKRISKFTNSLLKLEQPCSYEFCLKIFNSSKHVIMTTVQCKHAFKIYFCIDLHKFRGSKACTVKVFMLWFLEQEIQRGMKERVTYRSLSKVKQRMNSHFHLHYD